MEHHADEILKNLVTAMVDINGMKSQHHSEFHVSIEVNLQLYLQFVKQSDIKNKNRAIMNRIYSKWKFIVVQLSILLKKLEQDDDDQYLDSPWADGGSLKRHFQDLTGVKIEDMGEGEDAEEERNRNCARNWWTKPKWTKA
ncbi:hypothetical protein APICC_04442 [Apis cerana cerana]|uniref:Uncharacterized protein n=1 Tax=Apis cerana cerana TaxID=94128 RepID=A0A2A3ENM6_APICC|nr:hypothetical protein APICC_04442 [Apis cerana cerana]